MPVGVSRELFARAWAAGAGPGDSPLTIDLDSTICETYGLAKEGARHHGYTGARGYHPLLAIAAGTGEVRMSRLRDGRANAARGAAHFLRETVGRVRYGGARGQLTVRADNGFYAHTVVAACREMDVRFSITLCISPGAGLGKPSSVAPWPGCKPFHSRPDGQPATDPTSPQTRATPVARVPCCVFSRHPAHRNSRIGPYGPCAATEDRPPASHLPQDPRPSPL